MKVKLSLLILIISVSIFAEDKLEIFVYNQPEYEFYEFSEINSWQESVKSDSVKQIHLFSGKILNSYIDDIFQLSFLQNVKCDLALPTDFFFHKTPGNLDYPILASNLSSDSLLINDHYIVETDSIKVGFFSIYTPDLAVKNDFSNQVKINYKIFELVEQYAKTLKKKCDYVVLLSSMSRIIDDDLIEGLPIDLVISFDYQKKKSGILPGGRTQYCSVITSNNQVGKISLSYNKGQITTEIEEIEQKLATKADEAVEIIDAAGDK